ncbi:WhiB family transcriptional regulator [Microbacterium sp.]|uniref:WhiB family transcriptional regulator n=1 Tax=Microbacterium sp. TaxID=51671 RepID=UPI0039E56BCD
MSNRPGRPPATSPAYTALTEALAASATPPPCADDPRFTADHDELALQEVDYLTMSRCYRCPLRPLCRAYGDETRPAAGIWGGRTYPAKEKP